MTEARIEKVAELKAAFRDGWETGTGYCLGADDAADATFEENWFHSATAALEAANQAIPEAMREARWKRWPNGDAGDAIDYALGHIDDPADKLDFLDDWRSDLAIRPDYAKWLNTQREGARASLTQSQEGKK